MLDADTVSVWLERGAEPALIRPYARAAGRAEVEYRVVVKRAGRTIRADPKACRVSRASGREAAARAASNRPTRAFSAPRPAPEHRRPSAITRRSLNGARA